ncbi:MAG: hypothetical protein LBQ09_05675 [Acidobacteriaceae bacterium]|jgi:hypothetical protein|nr:hypothetical protein [Acidobacteriaceae bacterium]
MRLFIAVVACVSLAPLSARADTTSPSNPFTIDLVQGRAPGVQPSFGLTFPSPAPLFSASALTINPAVLNAVEPTQDAEPQRHAVAVEHTDAFLMRAKIHKYASFASLPLFGAEVALGQSLFNSDNMRGLHGGVGAAITGLFVVNTVTGAWNLFGEEGRAETEGRGLRLVHGLLMMVADAGFVATSSSAPGGSLRRTGTFQEIQDARVRHRTIALASMSVGTLGYLIMLFGNH